MIGAALAEQAQATNVVVADVAAVDDFGVAVEGGEIVLRVYTPRGEGPHPAFLHIHGGGFTFGSIDWAPNAAKCAHVCANAPCVVTTVEYRLAPEFPFPAATEDCYVALLWLAAHADELNVDASRIAIGGESAGGCLAAVVALMARDRSAGSCASDARGAGH